MSTQCQPPRLGSSLSSETQKPCSARCGMCTWGAVAHAAVQVHLQCHLPFNGDTKKQSRALTHKCCSTTHPEEIQTSPKRKGPRSSSCCVFDPAQGFPSVSRPRVAAASSLSASLQVLGSPDAKWPRFFSGSGKEYSPLSSSGQDRQPWIESEAR